MVCTSNDHFSLNISAIGWFTPFRVAELLGKKNQMHPCATGLLLTSDYVDKEANTEASQSCFNEAQETNYQGQTPARSNFISVALGFRVLVQIP